VGSNEGAGSASCVKGRGEEGREGRGERKMCEREGGEDKR